MLNHSDKYVYFLSVSHRETTFFSGTFDNESNKNATYFYMYTGSTKLREIMWISLEKCLLLFHLKQFKYKIW